ncbi:hypothetical protein ABK040_000581 [Willaertia magna]
MNEQQETTTNNNNVTNETDILTIYIKSLTGSKLKLQITKGDSTIEIKQLLAECIETCYITNYELKIKGQTLNDFSDIQNYPEIQDEAELTMHALTYDDKSARSHVYRLRELLYSKIDDLYLSTGIFHAPTKAFQQGFPSFFSSVKAEPYNDLGHALNCDLEFLQLQNVSKEVKEDENNNTTNISSNANTGGNKRNKNTNKKKKVTTPGPKVDRVEIKTPVITEEEGTEGEGNENNEERKPIITNKISVVELPQTPEELNSKNIFDPDSFKLQSFEPILTLSNTELPKCIRSITFSSFNPPSPSRKLKGDLFYLQIETLEGNTYHVTANGNGFYVNGTKLLSKFNPLPANKPHKNQTLLGLICEISPIFKSNFAKLLENRIQKHPFEVTPVPFVVNKWIDVEEKHEYDPNRAEESFFTMLGTDPRVQQREWNEEYQSCKELPSGTMDERLIRDRTLFKIHCDFVDSAIKGAKAVVDKCLLPINPIDKKTAQVYIQNNIFFSFSINTDEPKDENDMDQFAYQNANNDLKGVIAFNEADVPGIHTLASAIVDYRGYRVVAQSIIPGILQGDQGSKHVYGSIDDGKSFITDAKYHSLMKEAAEKLHIKEHAIIDEEGNEHMISCPAEYKGIVGSDGRFYVLDLIRTTVRDPNFLENKTAILRPELTQMYVASQQIAKQDKEGEKKEVVAFNTDIYTNTKLGGSEEEQNRDKENIDKLGQYLVETVIPKFVKSFKIKVEENPIDGRSLTELMHERGINMRYLGKLATVAKENKIPHLQLLAEQEMITRVAKHIFNKNLREFEENDVSYFISRFLNSLLGTNVEAPTEVESSKKDKKEKKELFVQSEVLSNIKEAIKSHFKYELEDGFMTKYQKYSTLRSFALKVGLKVLLKEYDFSVAAPINANDILALEPVVKHSTPKSKTANGLLEVGRQQLTKGNFEKAFEFLSQSIIMFQQIKGPMNNEVATCFSYLATILFNASDLPQAFLHQHNSLIISRRVLGLDNAILSQLHQFLGLLCYHVGQTAFALKHFLRARYINLLCCGFDHPELAHIMTNIGMMYQDLQDFPRSLKYLLESLRIYNVTLGEDSEQSAATHHAIAMTYNVMRQFKTALTHERRHYSILKEKYGEEDPRTKEASEWLEHFCGRAVAVEQELKVSEQEAMKLWSLHHSMNSNNNNSKKPPLEILNLLKEDQQKLSNLMNGLIAPQPTQQQTSQTTTQTQPKQQTTTSTTNTTNQKKKTK